MPKQTAVEAELLAGATVVRQGGLSAVLERRRPVSHGLHLLMTLLTAGGWGVVWIVMAATRKSDRTRLTVDGGGHVWADEGSGPA